MRIVREYAFFMIINKKYCVYFNKILPMAKFHLQSPQTVSCSVCPCCTHPYCHALTHTPTYRPTIFVPSFPPGMKSDCQNALHSCAWCPRVIPHLWVGCERLGACPWKWVIFRFCLHKTRIMMHTLTEYITSKIVKCDTN